MMRRVARWLPSLLIFALLLPATAGETRVLARCGAGALLDVDGHRVLRLSGTPYQVGYQHGALLKDHVNALLDAVVYGRIGSATLPLPSGYRHNLEEAWRRASPFISRHHLDELRGLADGCGRSLREVQLANIMPEFFHCSGVACFGKATVDGRLYHARVLDYNTKVGLQTHAVAIVYKMDGRPWVVNVGYAGFLGSVTGMNERGIAVGEMGGGGVGDWDGMPMGFLVREVLERSASLDEALRIFKETPRTCEYYYVVSDGPQRTACGIHATSREFTLVRPGEVYPRLHTPFPDAVLMSAGSRYDKLVERMKVAHGRIDLEMMQKLIKRPVAAADNLHCVIFLPEERTLWAAHADGLLPACDQRYSRLSLPEILAVDVQKAPVVLPGPGSR